jgi:single-stranded-DNA-specific exonuclease
MDVGFTIAPRINAASRMGEPKSAFNMLAETDIEKVNEHVEHLHKINDQRKGHVAAITKYVYQKLEDVEDLDSLKVVVVGNPSWQPSLLGLAASSIVGKYQKPTFLWGRGDGEELKGSCRSASGLSTLCLMTEVSDMMHAYGGHGAAGGFVIKTDQVDFLSDKLNEAYKKLNFEKNEEIIFVDSEILISDINKKMFQEIYQLSPFGIGNEEPKFLIKNILLKDVQSFGKNKEHIKIICEQNKRDIEAIAFFSDENSFSNKITKDGICSIVATIEKNQWGRVPFRLRLLDVIL